LTAKIQELRNDNIAVCDLVEYSICLIDILQKYTSRPEINFRIVETLHVTSLQVGFNRLNTMKPVRFNGLELLAREFIPWRGLILAGFDTKSSIVKANCRLKRKKPRNKDVSSLDFYDSKELFEQAGELQLLSL